MIRIESFAKANKNNNNGGSGGNTTIINNNVGGGGELNLDTHYFWGQPYNGKQDVSGDLTGVGSISASGDITTTGDIGGQYITVNEDLTVNGDANFGNDVGITGDLSADDIVSNTINSDEGNIGTLTVENLEVTKAAHFFSLIIDEVKSVGGQLILTPANATIDKVVELSEVYRCYFKATDGDKEIHNQFESDDQVICQTFNAATGTSYNVSNTYYWRLCEGHGLETIDVDGTGNYTDCHYIDLSKTDADPYSISEPQKGDKVCLLGNRTDATRQNAIIISAYDNSYLDPQIKAPSIVQYKGINNYSLQSHRMNVLSNGLNSFKGDFTTSAGRNVDSTLNGVSQNLTTLNSNYSQLSVKTDNIQAQVTQNTTRIDGLEASDVGGTNLIHNSAFANVQSNGVPKKWVSWSNNTPTREIVEINKVNWCHIICNDKWQGLQQRDLDRWGTTINEGFKGNTNYTIAYDAFGSGTTGAIIHFYNSSGQIVNQTNTGSFTLTNTPTRYSYTFKTPDDASIVGFNVLIGQSTTGNSEIYFSHPKLERGAVATDWSPSPYDTTDAIATINQNITNVDVKADGISAQVQSNTANINTLDGKVTASQTDIANLSVRADKIQSNVSVIMNGDPRNRFGTASFDGIGTIENNKWEFTSTCSQYSNYNLRNYGTNVVNGDFSFVNNSVGTSSLYTPAVSLSSSVWYTLTANLLAEDTSAMKIELMKYPSKDDAYNLTNGSLARTIYSGADIEKYYNDDVFPFQGINYYCRIRFSISTTSSSLQTADGYISGGQVVLYSGQIDAGDFAPWNQQAAKYSSSIQQTAREISLAVDETNLKINSGQITLNGNTNINGTLNVNNDDTGFILNDSSGMSCLITPQPFTQYDDFINSDGITQRINRNLAYRVAAGASSVTWELNAHIGNFTSGQQLNLGQFALSFSPSVTSVQSVFTIKDIDYGTTIDTYTTSLTSITSTFKTINFTSNKNVGINLRITATINPPSNPTDYICSVNLASKKTTNEVARLGSDGYAVKFTNGRNLYMSEDGSYWRYDDYGFSVNPSGLFQRYNGTWIPYRNITNIRNLIATGTTQLNNTDEFVIVRNNGQASGFYDVFLPTSPYIGQKIYFKVQKSGSHNIRIRANSSIIIEPNGPDYTSNWAMGQVSAFLLYDGEYWNAFYCG